MTFQKSQNSKAVLLNTFKILAPILYEHNAIAIQGTLLAIVRKGFICNDDDIDFLVPFHLKDKLIKKFRESNLMHHTIQEETQICILIPKTKEYCQVDLYYMENVSHLNCFMERHDRHVAFAKEFMDPFQTTVFEKEKVWIPADAEQICQLTQGFHWNKPLLKSEYNWEKETLLFQVKCKCAKVPDWGCRICKVEEMEALTKYQ